MADVVLGAAKWMMEEEIEKVRRKVRTVIAKVNGPSSDQHEALRPEEMSLNSYALLQAYILMAVTGLGYLALTWSTVVLLGGFVSSVGKKDFWCLTAISMVQAARIFNDSEDNLFPIFVELTEKLVRKVFANPVQVLQKVFLHPIEDNIMTVLSVQSVLFIVQILSIPVLVAVLVAGIVYVFGPVACIVLSVWRIRQRDYGNTGQDDSEANLVPALDIFYSLVICQGALFFIWLAIHYSAIWIVASFREQCKLPEKWGKMAIVQYLSETRRKCWNDPASIKGRNLINYAVELVGSESQKDYLSGAKMLDNFIRLGADVRSLLLPSRPKIQKLIDTLGWRSSDREIRELVARIVAYLAGDIHLSQFPGAIQCISSLLDTTLPYWNNQQGPDHDSPQIKSKDHSNVKYGLIFRVKGINQRRKKGGRNKKGDAQQTEVDSSIHESKRDDWNELILQGLTILERLAFDQHNCMDICSTPGLLPKIMAPLKSETLIRDININSWAAIVNRSFQVVHRLMRVPDWTDNNLCSEIFSSKHTVSNLEKILDGGNGNVELQMRAIEILTELALDVQTDLASTTKEKLIKKQLQIFLTDDKQEEHATKFITKRLKEAAGKTLALLSKTATMSALVVREYEDIVEIVDAKNKIIYRSIAAEILENLCSHHTIDKESVKNNMLPKVLKEVLTSQRKLAMEASRRKISSPRDDAKNHQLSAPGDDAENQQLTAHGDDEENQQLSAPGSDEEIQQLPAPGNDEENQLSGHNGHIINSSGQANEMELKEEKEFKEALLSLTLMICEKQIISADEFDEVARKIAPGEGGFVAKLKIIVEENCEATANSLRIVKLCGQIALTMMRRGQYMAHFKDQKFVETLSKAGRIMCNLESCMLFAGTDGGAKNTARPLLSDLVEEAQAMVA